MYIARIVYGEVACVAFHRCLMIVISVIFAVIGSFIFVLFKLIDVIDKRLEISR